MSWEGSAVDGDERLRAAVAAIDAANAGDPATLLVRGEVRPKEQAHAELMTEWVHRLDPEASEAQLLAARAHHLRRWSIPRSSFPEGRAGYLRWRSTLQRQHAEEVAGILRDAGYDDHVVAEVQRLIRKEGLRRDPPEPAVQVHEDALCLVFLETQCDDLAVDLGPDKAVDVLRKTLVKMSPAGIDAAASLPLSDGARALLGQALTS
jgi:hypothetical protein